LNAPAKKSTSVAVTDKNAPSNVAVHQPTPNTGLVAQFAAKYSIEADKMLETLKQTAFKQRPPKGGGEVKVVSNEQMMALLVIAKEYGLNPFTREIYAFPSENGIVPIIGFDGWVRLINLRPEFDYMDIRTAPEETAADDYYVEVEIKRKDRSRPTIVREYLKECYRDTGPWNEMPKRMTRHKAIIQCGRIAFGYAGVYDPDDAERVYANAIDVTPRGGKPETRPPQAKQIAAPDEPAVERITLDQATMLADKLKEEGVALNLLLARFEIGSLEELQVTNFDAAIAAIDEASAS
jgi:hypothetical protein